MRPDQTWETLRSVMEPSAQSRNNIYALERDLYHGQFCYDNDYQFNFEVLLHSFERSAVFIVTARILRHTTVTTVLLS